MSSYILTAHEFSARRQALSNRSLLGVNEDCEGRRQQRRKFTCEEYIAAIDLGTNSFELAIAQIEADHYRTIYHRKEKVQLGQAVEEHRQLQPLAIERSLACLQSFKQALQAHQNPSMRIVGTHCLRIANNRDAFINEASKLLNHPIDIISGIDEARLIYQGAVAGLPSAVERMVIDVGGGSTEFALGQNAQPHQAHSTIMGCLNFQERFFKDGFITEQSFHDAESFAIGQLLELRSIYKNVGQEVLGCSGAIQAVLHLSDNANEILHYTALQKLRQSVYQYTHMEQLNFPHLLPDQRSLIPGTLAILLALFGAFHIPQMRVRDATLKDGLLWNLWRERRLS